MPGAFKLDHLQPFKPLLFLFFHAPQTRESAVCEAGGHGLGVDEVVTNSGTLFRGREAEVERTTKRIDCSTKSNVV